MIDRWDIELWAKARDFVTEDKYLSWYDKSKELAKILDIEYPYKNFAREINFTPELRSRLEALTGPYGLVILKIMKLRREHDRT